MSTYIIAYANGPFKYLESSYKSPLSGAVRPLRLYGKLIQPFFPTRITKRHIATANGVSQAQFALDVLTKVMPIYEKMFDIEYPLPKLDILAVSIGSS